MELIGVIKLIGEEQTFGTNGFRVRKTVITTEDEQYPQMIEIQFQQDKCSLLDNYEVGQKVKININIRGREWINPEGEAKYFNSIVGWRIEDVGDSAPASSGPPPTPPVDEDHDDLPF